LNNPIDIEVRPEEAGQRLDRLLSARLQTPRNQIQQWVRAGRVLLGGESVKSSHAVVDGEIFRCQPPSRDLARGIEPESGDLEILHEDSDLLVLNKPVGLVVHPGAGRDRGTLVHRLLSRFPEISEVGGPGRPGIVHRLDKDTSGVMVIARSPAAYESLSQAFAQRLVDKRYLAIVYGTPRESTGRIESPIGRHPTRRKEMTIRSTGRPALTLYRCLGAANGIAALEMDLATGRTHQIRVHLKSIGHPLIGDPVYGEARWKGLPKMAQGPLKSFSRPALHAWRLQFEHPTSGERLTVETPLPEDMSLLWEEVAGMGFPDSI
jgi:23S rRNA pseudouridine1911/1915/1917 synthase